MNDKNSDYELRTDTCLTCVQMKPCCIQKTQILPSRKRKTFSLLDNLITNLSKDGRMVQEREDIHSWNYLLGLKQNMLNFQLCATLILTHSFAIVNISLSLISNHKTITFFIGKNSKSPVINAFHRKGSLQT